MTDRFDSIASLRKQPARHSLLHMRQSGLRGAVAGVGLEKLHGMAGQGGKE